MNDTFTMQLAFAMVAARYTRADEKHPRCPMTLQVLQHGSKSSSYHNCHILPKCLEKTVCVGLSNNANNIFPTIDLIHKNMELYQKIPNVTVKFDRAFNEHFDKYTIVFSPKLLLLDDLRVCIGATDPQPRCALFAKGSRPFLELHHRAFTEHHKPIVPTMAVSDFHVSQQLFSQIMLQTSSAKSAARDRRPR